MAESDTIEKVDQTTKFVHEDGDEEKFSHYVDKSKIPEATVFGTALTALCGKVWVPTRDPEKFPVCPDCKAVYDSLPD